jgi:glycerophosphoryl diester phosphodiesterase
VLLPLLQDKNPQVLQATLVALARMPGEVSTEALLPLLSHADPSVRGAAALALARHQPEVALQAIPGQLRMEMKVTLRLGDDYVRRGKPQLTQAEIDEVTGHFRCQMKMVQALAMLKGPGAVQALEEQAFRPGDDFAQFDGIVSAFQLWDRIGTDTQPAIQALGSTDSQLADRTEWLLVQAGPVVLPAVRKALSSQDTATRERAIQIVAWQGDEGALPTLRGMQQAALKDAELAAWAINKIETLHPKL